MNFKDRKFEFVLYPEDKTHVAALDLIKKTYDYLCVLHDRDVDDDGNLKKPHWHVLVTGFNSPTWSSSVCSTLGLSENCIQKVHSFKNAMRYLIHKDNADKAQYSVDSVEGNIIDKFLDSVGEGITELKAVGAIFEFLESSREPISYRDLFKFVLDNDLYGYYRSSYQIIKDLLYQHNQFIKFADLKEQDFQSGKERLNEMYYERIKENE